MIISFNIKLHNLKGYGTAQPERLWYGQPEGYGTAQPERLWYGTT